MSLIYIAYLRVTSFSTDISFFQVYAISTNLTVDLIFLDTTNTYFEIDDPGPSELEKYRKSKQKRNDLPQITIGLAVTREGIPVRCRVMPGN